MVRICAHQIYYLQMLHLSITEMYYMIARYTIDNNASYVFSLFSGSITTAPFTQNWLIGVTHFELMSIEFYYQLLQFSGHD